MIAPGRKPGDAGAERTWTSAAGSPAAAPRGLTVATMLAIIAVTVAVLAPSLGNGFVDWDDDRNFLTNPHYRGLGPAQLVWMFTSALTGHWIPLSWLTLGADYAVWGMNPVGYHLTNVLLHAAGAGVFLLLAVRLLAVAMPGRSAGEIRLGAAGAAAAFALHPLRAESVAWITERRDVLAGLFFLLTIATYLRACEQDRPGRRCPRRRWWLGASVACYALALMSKSIVLTLPFVLLVLDVFPLRRLGGSWRGWLARERRHIWLEKAPYLALSLAAAMIALAALRSSGYLTPAAHLPLEARVALATYGLGFYLWKTIVPLGLTPLYELPLQIRFAEPGFLTVALAVVALGFSLWLFRRRWPAGLAAGAIYGAILLPVSVRIHAGHQLVADRYSYFACLPWALLFGAALTAVAGLAARRQLRPIVARVAIGGAALWITASAVLTWHQVQVWRDTGSLWRHALEVDPGCALCESQLGAWLGRQGLVAAALEHFDRGLALRPDHGPLRLNHATALLVLGRSAEAANELRVLAERYPADANVRGRLGAALAQRGDVHAAIVELGEAVRLNPGDARARFELARVHLDTGDEASARAQSGALRRLDAGLADRFALVTRRPLAPAWTNAATVAPTHHPSRAARVPQTDRDASAVAGSGGNATRASKFDRDASAVGGAGAGGVRGGRRPLRSRDSALAPPRVE